MRIIGVDLSTSRVGVASGIKTVSFTPDGSAQDSAKRLYSIATTVAKACQGADVVVIEDIAPGSYTRTVTALARVQGAVLAALHRAGIDEYRFVNPTTLKMFATGRGRASKGEMIAAAEALGGSPADDDQADAFHLARFGRVAWHLEQAKAPHETTAIDKAGIGPAL